MPSDTSFSFIATITANTKRASLTAGYQDNLNAIPCTPLAPLDAQTQLRLDLKTPHVTFETFFDNEPDIKKGDLLVVGSVEYPVIRVAPWPWLTTKRLHVVVEDLRS